MVSACNKDQACSFRAMGCFAAEREFSLHVGVACLVCVCMHTRMSVCVRETACWAGLCILFSLPSVFLQNTLLKEYGGEGGVRKRNEWLCREQKDGAGCRNFL